MPDWLVDIIGGKPRLMSLSSCGDFGGNTFIAMVEYSKQTNYDGSVRLVKIDSHGTLTTLGYRSPKVGKGDSCTILQVGDSIQPYLSVHVLDPETQLQALEPFLHVATPYPHGQPNFGAPGAYTAQDVRNEVYTLEQIAAAVDAKMAPRFSNLVTITNIKDVLAQFVMDRVYQTFNDNVPGFWKWLRDKVGIKVV